MSEAEVKALIEANLRAWADANLVGQVRADDERNLEAIRAQALRLGWECAPFVDPNDERVIVLNVTGPAGGS